MSNTPKTDRNWRAWLNKFDDSESFLDFAGRLERERDEANKELHKHLAKYDALFDEAEKIRVGRDEARECYKTAMELAARYKSERDEAREAFAVATSHLVQAQEMLREIAAADWKTSGELRGMAKRLLEGKK